MTTVTAEAETSARPEPVTLGQAFWVWLRIAMLSFGGPAGQIAIMHRILVDEKRWIGEQRFLHALNYCMLLPGPEAQQLATYIGWLMHRTKGGIVAGVLFVIPGAVAIMALSWIYVLYGRVGIVSALFFGLKCAVLAVVLQAVVRIGGRALTSTPARALAVLAFVLIFFVGAPFPLIVLSAGLIGWWCARQGSTAFRGGGHGASKGAVVADVDTLLGEDLPAHARPTWGETIRTALVWLALWLVPVAALLIALGPDDVFSRIATFFSTMAMVTFGGAYAVLAYVAQQAVENYGWLGQRRCWTASAWRKRRPGRSSWSCNSSASSAPIAIPAGCPHWWRARLVACSRPG
jgi:chromate transporter